MSNYMENYFKELPRGLRSEEIPVCVLTGSPCVGGDCRRCLFAAIGFQRGFKGGHLEDEPLLQ